MGGEFRIPTYLNSVPKGKIQVPPDPLEAEWTSNQLAFAGIVSRIAVPALIAHSAGRRFRFHTMTVIPLRSRVPTGSMPSSSWCSTRYRSTASTSVSRGGLVFIVHLARWTYRGLLRAVACPSVSALQSSAMLGLHRYQRSGDADGLENGNKDATACLSSFSHPTSQDCVEPLQSTSHTS